MLAECDGDGFRAVRRADLREQRVDVYFDTAAGDAELKGDVPVRVAVAEGLQDFLLSV